jgi:pyridoxamine-phosphate oxidase
MPTWEPLDDGVLGDDPFAQFVEWFDQGASVMHEREAIVLVTASRDAHPSARMVLLRYVGPDGFGWYTNYDSRKGHDLAENPNAAILWFCEPLGRQIRIEGTVAKMSTERSDAYFNDRPRGHQLGAHASNQSAPISSRDVLVDRLAVVTSAHEGIDVARPEHWGGYLLTPTVFEFWQQRNDRLHDRFVYTQGSLGWVHQRHAP